MKQVRLIMGMPITVEIVDTTAVQADFDLVFSYFRSIDEQFSPYKATSEVTRINNGEIKEEGYSKDMRQVLVLAEQTKQDTHGYFDVWHHGIFDPSGVVKGWSIYNAAKMLDARGFKNFYVDAGGDIEVRGKNAEGKLWRIGIRNPFEKDSIIKMVALTDMGIATSGTYIRGQHIYNPHTGRKDIQDIVSLTVLAENVYEADRLATAAFAMGRDGIAFLSKLPHVDAYMIDAGGIATMTEHFESYVPMETTSYAEHH